MSTDESYVERAGAGGSKIRSSRALADQFRAEQDAREAQQRAAARALRAPVPVDDPLPPTDRDPHTDLTLVEAEACGLVTLAQLQTLEQCHGTPEHEVQRTRILEIAQEKYNVRRLHWPRCAPGPMLPGPRGLLIPYEIRERATAERVRQQLEESAQLRELFRHERQALRALKRNGVRWAGNDAADQAALERARLKRLSKAAKRARHAQAVLASVRAHRTDTPTQEVAC